jgi:hypothetical protein
MTDTLFPELEPTPGFVKAEPKVPEPKLSADRRRTKRQKDMLANGVHPITRQPLSTVEGATCGTCALRHQFGHRNKTYAKCTLGAPDSQPQLGPHVTRSASSDVRAWWTACLSWQTKNGDG